METPGQPQRFGSYLVLERIGDGGMAEIFLAKMTGYSGFEKYVALKKILPRYSSSPAFAKMLIHEAKLAAQLSHPNIIEVQECNEDSDGTPFSVMEPLCGRSLYRALVEEGTFSLGRALDILRPLASALQFANDHGIVHAGLKLGSIFLHEQRRGEGLVTYCEVVKLLRY